MSRPIQFVRVALRLRAVSMMRSTRLSVPLHTLGLAPIINYYRFDFASKEWGLGDCIRTDLRARAELFVGSRLMDGCG